MDYILAILSFIEIKLKFGTWRQNRDFFGTFLALWSHLGPSPKFGTLSERLVLEVPTTVDPNPELKSFGHRAIWSSCKHV